MILFKAALLNFKKSVMMNIFTLIEMTAAIIIFIVMVSSVLIRYTYYEPFKDMYEGKGLFVISFGMNSLALSDDPEMKNYYHPVSDIEIYEFLHGAEKIAGFHDLWADPDDSGDCYSCNDELIKRFQPKLKEGRWLNTSDKADKIEVVISENDHGWQVGDVIEIEYLYTPLERADDESYNKVYYFPAEVVGILEKGTRVFGLNSNYDDNADFNKMYAYYDFEVEENPILLFSSDYLYNEETLKDRIWQELRAALIQYPDDIAKEQLTEDQAILSRMNKSGKSYRFDIMEPENKRYIFEQIYNLLPVIIVILILTLVSSISSTALTTRDRLRDYSIYYITGLRWRQCVLINLIQSAVISVLSLITAAGAMYLVKFTSLGESVTVIAHPWTALSAVGLILLYILVSMVMPIIIIGKSTPKEILTR